MGTGNGVVHFIGQMKNIKILLDDPTIHSIDEETRSDLASLEMRRNHFRSEYPLLTSIPMLGPFVRLCYSLGFQTTAALLTVLILFTAIKAPYFGIPFTGAHSMKYSAYVEAAQHMVEKNDPTWYQLKYQSVPVYKPKGIHEKFGHFPLYEWGLFATYKLLPTGNIEFKTRIFSHGIGILILVFGFFFFRRWIPTNLTLLLIFLMAFNPIITFATFVTVLDSLTVVLTFISLILLNNYLASRNLSWLFWAGLVFGMGNCVKYSSFLWGAPIGVSLLFARSDDRAVFLRDSAIYTILGALCIVANLTSLSMLPGAPGKALILTALWVLVFFLILVAIRKFIVKVDKITARICGSWILLAGALGSALAAGIVVLRLTSLWGYVGEFLTDSSLMFNPRLYAHMFRIQFKSYATPTIFWMGLAGLALVFFSRGRDLKKVTAALWFGSVVYWVIASKSMFIHNYYTIVIMIAINLSAATAIYYILLHFPSSRVKLLISLLLLVLIFPRAYEASGASLGKQQDISEVNRFILDNTEEDDLILHETLLTPITIYTGRGLIYPHSIRTPMIRDEIRKLGFAETMKKYRIRYLLTENENPMYINFAPIFTNTAMKNPLFDRDLFIFREIGEISDEMEEKNRELEEVVKRFGIEKKFRLVAKTGKFRFFSFVN